MPTSPFRAALTPTVDTVPFERTLLSLLSHPFLPHAKGSLGGPVLQGTIWY